MLYYCQENALKLIAAVLPCIWFLASTNWLHTFFCNDSETCQGCKRRWNVCALWSDGSSFRRRRWEHPRLESHHSLRHPRHPDASLLFRGWEALLLLPEMPKIRPIGLVSVQIFSEYTYWQCIAAFHWLLSFCCGFFRRFIEPNKGIWVCVAGRIPATW